MRTTAIILAAFAALTFCQPAHASVAKVKSIIRQEAKKMHCGKADVRACVILAGRESTWRPWAHGAFYGLFQLSQELVAKAMSWNPKWRWWNPRQNTRMAIRYMRWRWGSPCGALQHSYACNWY